MNNKIKAGLYSLVGVLLVIGWLSLMRFCMVNASVGLGLIILFIPFTLIFFSILWFSVYDTLQRKTEKKHKINNKKLDSFKQQ